MKILLRICWQVPRNRSNCALQLFLYASPLVPTPPTEGSSAKHRASCSFIGSNLVIFSIIMVSSVSLKKKGLYYALKKVMTNMAQLRSLPRLVWPCGKLKSPIPLSSWFIKKWLIINASIWAFTRALRKSIWWRSYNIPNTKSSNIHMYLPILIIFPSWRQIIPFYFEGWPV